MKKMSIAAMATGLCLVLGVGSASAGTFNIDWFNSINSYLYMDAQPSCTVTAKAMFAGGSVDSKTIALADKQRATTTLSAVTCTAVALAATCSFKDAKGNQKTETKVATYSPCGGTLAVLVPDPDDRLTYTSFKFYLSRY